MQNNNINKIDSLENTNIKELIRIRDNKKYRRELSQCFVESEKIVFDIDKNIINEIYISETYDIDKLNQFSNIKINVLTEKVFNKIKNTENSQGIIAKVDFSISNNIDKLINNNNNLILLLDSINDPGNLGTIIRMSEACGINDVILTNNCTDVYSPKVLRSCMGSSFRINIYEIEDAINIINQLKNNNYTIYSTKMNTNTNYYDINYKNNKSVIVFGNEANGISEEILNISDKKIKIPMKGQIESLNVAMSASIICYEVFRQVNNEN